MIISASYRTDIPAFYGAWFENRLTAGYCLVANPYGGGPYRVSLERNSVSGFVFWTKNAGPFLPTLERLADRGFPFVVQYTINAYPRVLETSVTDSARAATHVRDLAARYGPRAVVWRYDPIIETSETPLDWHVDNFARLAGFLAGATDEAVVSFANVYQKTRRNLDATARATGLAWSDPPDEAKRETLARLTPIATAHGMTLTVCSQPAYTIEGTAPARCVDAARLGDVAGHPIKARLKGNREGCACHESRDIGAYDTCPHGCIYCYAVATRARARARFAKHDPEGEFLVGA